MRKKNIYGLCHKGKRTWERTFCEGHMGNMVRAHEQDHTGKKHGLGHMDSSTWTREHSQEHMSKGMWTRANGQEHMGKGTGARSQGKGHRGKGTWTRVNRQG